MTDGLGAKGLLAKLRASRFGRNVAMLAGGTAIAHAVTLASAPILTRLYAPSDFGILGIFVAYVGFAATIACVRYDVAVVAAETREEAASLTLASILLAIGGALLAAGALFLLVRYDGLGFGELPPLGILLAGIAVFFTAAFTALRYWFIREESFPLIAKVAVWQGFARVIVNVSLGILAVGWIGLVSGEMVSRIAGIGRMMRAAAEALRSATAAGFGAMKAAIRKHRAFAVYSLPSTLLDAIALQLPLPLLAEFYGTTVAGQFTLVQRLLTVPLAFLTISVADTFHGRAAVFARENPSELRGLFLRTAGGLLLAAAGPMLLIMVVAPFTFGAIFGEEWQSAGWLATIIAPMALAQLTVAPVSRIVFVIEKIQPLKLVYSAILLVLVFGTFAGGSWLGWSPYAAVACYAASGILAYGLYFMLMLVYLPKPEQVKA